MKHPISVTIISRNSKETANIGHYLARQCTPGSVIALTGDLGSGKSVLSRSIASALGSRNAVKSPTFVLTTMHPILSGGLSMMFHIDCYRIKQLSETDYEALAETIATPKSVSCIEWADRVPTLLAIIPKKHLTTIAFTVLPNRQRVLTVSGALTPSARKWARAHSSQSRVTAG